MSLRIISSRRHRHCNARRTDLCRHLHFAHLSAVCFNRRDVFVFLPSPRVQTQSKTAFIVCLLTTPLYPDAQQSIMLKRVTTRDTSCHDVLSAVMCLRTASSRPDLGRQHFFVLEVSSRSRPVLDDPIPFTQRRTYNTEQQELPNHKLLYSFLPECRIVVSG